MSPQVDDEQTKLSTIVIKIGGSALNHHHVLEQIVDDVEALLKQSTADKAFHVVIVHGGGPHVNARLKEMAVEPRFVEGLRVTDKQTLAAALSAFATVGNQIVESLSRRHIKAMLIDGKDGAVLSTKAEPLAVNGQSVNLGLVGKIQQIDLGKISRKEHPSIDYVPVISPVGVDKTGALLNVNADHVATSVACALKADHLFFLSDVPGVLSDVSDPASCISLITEESANRLFEGGIISGGMIPKVRNCLEAVDNGVSNVTIADGRQPGVIAKVIETPGAVGSTIRSCA